MNPLTGSASRVVVLLCLAGATLIRASDFTGIVVAWGDNSAGQTNVPPQLTNAIAFSAGHNHSLAVTSDGFVLGWGANSYGKTNPPAGLSNVIAVAAGGDHSLALGSDGGVVGWGFNNVGQVNIPATARSGVEAIAAGYSHNLALKRTGAVIGWGGELYGIGVPAGTTGVVAIAAGGFTSLALKNNGQVIAWGYNQYGQANVPQAAQTGVVAIGCGFNHSLALRSDGTIVAWGNNDVGQTNVPAGLSNVVAIAAGEYHNLALRADGTVVPWGADSSIPPCRSNVVAISAGGHNLAATSVAPTIMQKPPRVITLNLGGACNLAPVVYSATQFASQWYLNGSAIEGATNTSFSISAFGFEKAGQYVLTISNQFGFASAKSLLRLTNSPSILVDGEDFSGEVVKRVASAVVTISSTFGTTAHIHYTADGSAPDFTDTAYSGSFTVSNTVVIRAIAYNSAYTDWAEASPTTVQIWPTYPLTTTALGGGSVGVSPAAYSGGNRYVSNTVVMLTATPANGWSFLHWTGDSTATSNVTTVLMDRPRAVQAVFGTSLNLFTNGNGQLLLNPPVGPYAFGSLVQLTALPAAGAYFFGWAGAAGGFANPLSFAVTNPTPSLTALFGALKANEVSLTVLPDGNGTVSVSPSKIVYTNGETVTLTAWPGANQRFTNWSGDASGNLDPLQLTLTASQVITANFVPGAATNPPVITQSPLSRTLSAGADTLLSFGLTGDGPFSYQWRLNSSPLSGATNPTLLLTGVTPAQVGCYDVTVTGQGGAVTSAPASVALFGLEWALSSGQRLPLLVLDGPSGVGYRLEYSWNLSPTNWNLLAPVTPQGSRLYYVDELDTNFFRRFYRAVPQ